MEAEESLLLSSLAEFNPQGRRQDLKGGGSMGGKLLSRGVWGHAPPENIWKFGPQIEFWYLERLKVPSNGFAHASYVRIPPLKYL